jgi:polyhydroxybutyrate depolymerase
VLGPARLSRHACALVCAALLGLAAGCSGEPAVLGDANYAVLALPADCAANLPAGGAGATDDLQTSGGIAVSVRTPRNYDATRAHPLLVVLAPAGYDRHRSERFAGLTTSATSVGFVVAYADHIALTMAAFPQLGEIPKLVSARWCIDTARVSFAGHSDGGSSAAAMAFLNASSIRPAAVVVSGAGLRAEDLRAYACPTGIDAMIVHSRGDERFPPPAFGREPAQWWAACNQCAPTPSAADADGCMQFSRCASDTQVRYCEVATTHDQWPGLDGAMLKFVTQARN